MNAISPESEVIQDLLAALAEVEGSLDTSVELLRAPPRSIDEFASMGRVERTAATAIIKQVEQMEDLLARLFRPMLQQLALDTKGLFAFDIADRMRSLGVLDAEPEVWVELVKLRNRLVHEYPPSAAERLSRFEAAYGFIALLRAAHLGARRFCTSKGWSV